MLNDRVTETQLYITCRIYTHILLQFIDNEEFMSLEELLLETRELEHSVPTPATTDSSSEKLSELRKSFIDYDNQVKELINKQDEVISLQQDIVSTGRLLGGLLSLSERNVITSEVDKAKQLFNLSLRENKGKDISDIFNPLLFQNLVSNVKSTCPTITNSLEQLDCGASVRDELFKDTVPPLEIVRIKGDNIMFNLMEQKIREEDQIINHINSFYENMSEESGMVGTEEDGEPNIARVLNINVGDKKNTVLIQGCTSHCPDLYGIHSPGGGDFHCRGYINECIARSAGPGGFWHISEKVLKRPTVNPKSFKSKFKDNNYYNNEEPFWIMMMDCQ